MVSRNWKPARRRLRAVERAGQSKRPRRPPERRQRAPGQVLAAGWLHFLARQIAVLSGHLRPWWFPRQAWRVLMGRNRPLRSFGPRPSRVRHEYTIVTRLTSLDCVKKTRGRHRTLPDREGRADLDAECRVFGFNAFLSSQSRICPLKHFEARAS